MKKGDLVYFAKRTDTSGNVIQCDIGLLLKYEKWEKIAYILYNGKIHKVHASYARKAGKRTTRSASWG